MNTPYMTDNSSFQIKNSDEIARPQLTILMPRKKNTIYPLKFANLSQSLSKTIDLDCVFGHMSYRKFKKAYKQKVVVDVNNSTNRVTSHENRIKMNYKFGFKKSSKSTRQCPHVRIGTSTNTEFGNLDIYFVLLNSSITAKRLQYKVFKEIKRRIKAMRTPLHFAELTKIKSGEERQAQEIKCEVSARVCMKVIKFLFTKVFKNKKPVIFFETFGNKISTMTDQLDLNNLKKNIFSTFRRRYEKYVNVDVCLSASYGNGYVTLPMPKFFEEAQVKPNYFPLFSNAVMNCHRTVTNPTRKRINRGLGIFSHCYKLNFYSTYKYNFDFDRSKNYQFPLSLNSMLTNFYGHNVNTTQGKFENLITNYKNVEDLSKKKLVEPNIFYRCEVRCNLTRIGDIVGQLNELFVNDNFGYFESRDFFKVIQININKFLKIIRKVPTIEDRSFIGRSVCSVISEYIMKNFYIAGSRQISQFKEKTNTIIKKKMIKYRNAIGVLTNVHKVVKKIFIKLSGEEKLDILDNQVLYATSLNSLKKNLLRNLLLVSFEQIEFNENNCIKWMIETHIAEKQKSICPNFNDLYIPNETGRQKHILTKLKNIFVKRENSKKSNVAHILFTVFKMRCNIESDNSALLMIANFMHNLGIVSMYKYISPERNEMVSINYERIIIDIPRISENLAFDKKTILEKFIELGTFSGLGGVKITENDIVRYIHAMYKYSGVKDRICSILYDFAYGFFPLRNEYFIKNKQHNLKKFLLKNDGDFNRILTMAANWSPEDYSLSMRLNHLNENGIVLTGELKNIYIQLTNHDVNAWWDSSVNSEILKETTADVFKKVVLNSKAYRACMPYAESLSTNLNGLEERVKTWSENNLLPNVLVNENEVFENTFEPEFLNNTLELDFYNNNTLEPEFINNNIFFEPDFYNDNTFEPDFYNDNTFEPVFLTNENDTSFDLENAIMPVFINNNSFKTISYVEMLSDKSELVEHNHNFQIVKNKNLVFEDTIDEKVFNQKVKEEKNIVLFNSLEIVANDLIEFSNNQKEKLTGDNNRCLNVVTGSVVGSFFNDSVLESEINCLSAQNKILFDNEFNSKPNLELENLDEAIISSFQEKNDNGTQNFKNYKRKLFTKFKYTKFNIFRARNSIFNQKVRPDKDSWEKFINSCISENTLSKYSGNHGSIFYRFNLKAEKSGKYLNFEYILNSIKKHLNKNGLVDEKASRMRNNIYYPLRPRTSSFIEYLHDLVRDGYLKINRVLHCVQFFSLN